MKNKLRILAEQVLVALNILIVFLLIFTGKLAVPFWLQPIGRMHPLILHFPIVLLMLAVAMDIYRAANRNINSSTLYNNFSGFLLLSGALLTGITVIMGLFLSREEGYEGDTLSWHKWTGASVFFLASLIYFIRNKAWYKTPATWISAGLVALTLMATGHYGAVLTHGEDFIMQPVYANIQKPSVPVEQAIVYEHIVHPILEKKCTSCHNPNKLKGELALTDSMALAKGGKTGKLFVPGNPDISLLLERVHLPLEEKKHMPPDGKPQLTKEEIMLLTLWIREDAKFSQKLIDLPEDDSLRIVATAVLKPETNEEKYDFSPADEKTVAKLNNDYRTIAPVAKGSPALDVSIYNRDVYSTKQLDELGEIKKQVVSVNLNKLPVKDADLKSVSQFENLRRLDLNFTDVTEKGLDALTFLKHLHTLTLSGTKLSFNGLKEKVATLKNLKTLYVWNTGLTPGEIAQLKKDYKGISFIEGFKDDGKDTLKLNPPQVKNSEMVFASTTPVQLFHPVRGVEIRFTLDGTEPDSIHSPVFDNTTVIDKRTTVKAKAFKNGWYSSDVITFDFLRNSFVPDSAVLLKPLNSVHLAEGAKTFFNKKLGAIGANNPAWANFWAGVRNNDMDLVALFYKPITISSFGLHYMLEETTGIYPPELVEIWGGENESKLKLLATIKPPLPEKGGKPSLETLETLFKPQIVSHLKIIVKPHVEKERRFLVLVDEMFLN
ncbi:MAG: chitobiase/beta-hexosaminidase C-terminal domain-containing protein [Chitinophagaceae bacterium]|nr:chitobiase/beta-hexosaminidase C-terminal domain-containing protein [Chitinophagaceae bacterium]